MNKEKTWTLEGKFGRRRGFLEECEGVRKGNEGGKDKSAFYIYETVNEQF